jgi:hypothetical protein
MSFIDASGNPIQSRPAEGNVIFINRDDAYNHLLNQLNDAASRVCLNMECIYFEAQIHQVEGLETIEHSFELIQSDVDTAVDLSGFPESCDEDVDFIVERVMGEFTYLDRIYLGM